jgi:hypothetical protein
MPGDLLRDFARFSNRVLVGIENRERAAQKYKATLGLINQILLKTHLMVVEKVERLETATTIEQAREILNELNRAPLTESFRLEGLCDTFEGLGHALENLNARSESSQAFSPEELSASLGMANALTDRETEVAGVYVDGIQELADLVYSTGDSLRQIQGRAREVKALLTNQMSDFEVKSRQFLRSATG